MVATILATECLTFHLIKKQPINTPKTYITVQQVERKGVTDVVEAASITSVALMQTY